MFENFKTDIIYYNTASDFELEFNLCGCCRMRLFNDKCTDKKTLLLSLSRAVSRSKVIIITAPLFSEENIMKTVASAIGSKTEKVNNADYNIASDSEITVIKGALPLVTEDGIFGGCIIESGPQSLIILTDNKTVRKALMKNLLHQYIAEVSVRTPDSELITDDPEEVAVQAEEENTDSETEDEGLILDDGSDYQADDQAEEFEEISDEESPLILESEEEEDITEPYELEIEGLYTDISSGKPESEDDDGYYGDNDFFTEENDTKPSALNIWMLVISIVLLVALAVLCYCIFYVPTKAGTTPSAYLQEIFNTMFG